MTSDENIGSSNPSGGNQFPFPLIVDEDNATPSSPLLDRPKDVQPNNEIIEEEGKYKSIVILKERDLMRKMRLSAIIVRNCKGIQLWH